MPLLAVVLIVSSFAPDKLIVPFVEAQSLDFASTTVVRDYIETHAGDVARRALRVAGAESGFVWNEKGDMDIVCQNPNSPYYGQPVEARGVWQITKCYHSEVTDDQAYDVEWSTTWALPRLQDLAACRKEWTVCRQIYPQKASR